MQNGNFTHMWTGSITCPTVRLLRQTWKVDLAYQSVVTRLAQIGWAIESCSDLVK